MTKNIKYSEPPTYKGDDEFLLDVARYLRTVHENVYGLGGEGGSLDGNDNITSADDPGTADGTEAGNATTINQLVTNLKTTGIVGS